MNNLQAKENSRAKFELVTIDTIDTVVYADS